MTIYWSPQSQSMVAVTFWVVSLTSWEGTLSAHPLTQLILQPLATSPLTQLLQTWKTHLPLSPVCQLALGWIPLYISLSTLLSSLTHTPPAPVRLLLSNLTPGSQAGPVFSIWYSQLSTVTTCKLLFTLQHKLSLIQQLAKDLELVLEHSSKLLSTINPLTKSSLTRSLPLTIQTQIN